MLLDGPRRRKNAHVRAMPSPGVLCGPPAAENSQKPSVVIFHGARVSGWRGGGATTTRLDASAAATG
eukprot:7182079-Pyramimonas_sp.AAC.1